MARKRYLIFIIPMVLLWTAALSIATVYDLDISLAVADKNSVFGRVFEIIGEPPAILFASFNFAVITAFRLRCTALTFKDKLSAAVSAILSAGTVFFTVFKTCDYIFEWHDDLNSGFRLDLVLLLLAMLTALIITAVFFMLALTMSDETLRRVYPIAASCVKAAVATFIIIWAVKLTWGRVRFRTMYGDFAKFTPWYLPNIGGRPLFSGNYSFPSGHTANATVIISAVYYFRLFKGKAAYIKPLVCILLAVWTVTVAISRVLVGAHFLSDVLFGMAITLAIVFFNRPKQNGIK